MKNKMTLITKDGEKITYDIVAMFKNGNTSFIAYIDNIKNDTGKSDLLVSKYIENKGLISLEDITSEEEWNFVNAYLDEEVFNEMVYDD